MKIKSRTLISSRRYAGKHVAVESFNSSRIVAAGNDPAKVLLLAREKGYKNAVLLFVPSKNMTFVYDSPC
ncbi:MAG: DUF5678 domain-containing protein [Victivallales bacterium]